MNAPKLLILDRDGVVNFNSHSPDSPFYYILDSSDFVLKPNVEKAFTLLAALKVPVILATKQQCLSKGLLTVARLNDIHRDLQEKVGFSFAEILVEPKAETKSALFAQILAANPGIKPEEMLLIDDSVRECDEAAGLGIKTLCRTDLCSAICEAFRINL